MRKNTVTRCAILAIFVLGLIAIKPASAAADGKNKWLAAGLNFFVPGAGYMYNGKKPLYVTVPMIAGVVGLTYLEQFHDFGDGMTLKDYDSTAFGIMFAAVFVMNTAMAIDAYQEAGAINRARAKGLAGLRLDVKPIDASDGKRNFGLSLSGSF